MEGDPSNGGDDFEMGKWKGLIPLYGLSNIYIYILYIYIYIYYILYIYIYQLINNCFIIFKELLLK